MSRLYQVLDAIKGRVTDAFLVKNYSASITVGANNYGYATANALNMSTPTGYTPVAMVSISSDSTCPFFNISVKATGAQGAVWVKNVSASSQTFTVNLGVLYAKTALIGGGTA